MYTVLKTSLFTFIFYFLFLQMYETIALKGLQTTNKTKKTHLTTSLLQRGRVIGEKWRTSFERNVPELGEHTDTSNDDWLSLDSWFNWQTLFFFHLSTVGSDRFVTRLLINKCCLVFSYNILISCCRKVNGDKVFTHVCACFLTKHLINH